MWVLYLNVTIIEQVYLILRILPKKGHLKYSLTIADSYVFMKEVI